VLEKGSPLGCVQQVDFRATYRNKRECYRLSLRESQGSAHEFLRLVFLTRTFGFVVTQLQFHVHTQRRCRARYDSVRSTPLRQHAQSSNFCRLLNKQGTWEAWLTGNAALSLSMRKRGVVTWHAASCPCLHVYSNTLPQTLSRASYLHNPCALRHTLNHTPISTCHTCRSCNVLIEAQHDL
jgi:hypothetical protein